MKLLYSVSGWTVLRINMAVSVGNSKLFAFDSRDDGFHAKAHVINTEHQEANFAFL